jgi:hypothetical protein
MGGMNCQKKSHYAAIAGSLLYSSNGTRPDITYAVGVQSRFMPCQRAPHLQAAQHMLRCSARKIQLRVFCSMGDVWKRR